jgi:hypothetical protein
MGYIGNSAGFDGIPVGTIRTRLRERYECECDEPRPKPSTKTSSYNAMTGEITWYSVCSICGLTIKQRRVQNGKES